MSGVVDFYRSFPSPAPSVRSVSSDDAAIASAVCLAFLGTTFPIITAMFHSSFVMRIVVESVIIVLDLGTAILPPHDFFDRARDVAVSLWNDDTTAVAC
jgi:hypothetical protein